MPHTITEQKDKAAELESKLNVIDKALAVAEFNLDGTVRAANKNFLKILGYTLDEVKGQHHKLFCEAEHSTSSEYQGFWAKLNRGESEAGVYKRIGKGSKEVWIQASYNPMLDAKGKPTKVIALVADVTVQRLELENLRDELKVRVEIMNATSIVSEADLKGDIVSVNDKFIQVSKYPKNELIGRGHNTTRHPDMPKEVFKQMWATIGRGQIFRGVVKNRAKDGTPYYVDAVIAPFVDKKTGKPRKYLGVRYDITEQEIVRQHMKGVMDAIDKSYASIEFNLDGTVITANDNFLKILGYTLDEIKGRHHRMFCDLAYTSTGEYAAFWQKLSRGEFDAGVYRRIGKGNKEVWIQASYNSIKDEMGRPFKVVELATDITERKYMEEIMRQQEIMRQLFEERETVARNLHDGILQSLYAVRLGLEHCRRILPALSGHVMPEMDAQIEDISLVIAEVRDFMTGQDPPWARTQDFQRALEEILQLHRVGERPALRLHMAEMDCATGLSQADIKHLLYIVREAVSNTVRHASAEACDITIASVEDRLRVTIEDNGVGFVRSGEGRGRGIGNMEARARQIGATLDIASVPGRSTCITIEMTRREIHVAS